MNGVAQSGAGRWAWERRADRDSDTTIRIHDLDTAPERRSKETKRQEQRPPAHERPIWRMHAPCATVQRTAGRWGTGEWTGDRMDAGRGCADGHDASCPYKIWVWVGHGNVRQQNRQVRAYRAFGDLPTPTGMCRGTMHRALRNRAARRWDGIGARRTANWLAPIRFPIHSAQPRPPAG